MQRDAIENSNIKAICKNIRIQRSKRKTQGLFTSATTPRYTTAYDWAMVSVRITSYVGKESKHVRTRKFRRTVLRRTPLWCYVPASVSRMWLMWRIMIKFRLRTKEQRAARRTTYAVLSNFADRLRQQPHIQHWTTCAARAYENTKLVWQMPKRFPLRWKNHTRRSKPSRVKERRRKFKSWNKQKMMLTKLSLPSVQ